MGSAGSFFLSLLFTTLLFSLLLDISAIPNNSAWLGSLPIIPAKTSLKDLQMFSLRVRCSDTPGGLSK